MERQLAEYRARKSKEASHKKESFLKSLFARKPAANNMNITSSNSSSTSFTNNGSSEQLQYVELYPRFTTFLKISLWLSCLGLFVQVGFGSVFFVGSLFFFLYRSMRSGTRKAWEPSAYSVFNENCEAIEGTLSGEQFDKELKFGAGSVGVGK